MKDSETKKLLNNAIKARTKYESCVGKISAYAKIYIEFPYDDTVSCEYQPSDGYVIVLDAGSLNPYNMPLESFFSIAKENGIVTIDDFDKYSI
ncbi:hypothetical protein [uncultured Dysgonomonas sp.]|uniref:Uncharacterized protein n=1 Tax=uncultured Dysgonomonas sp. TaxID=206096 RepID=A0A212IX98_9BACT|nr:hypothetical protein [uncultured Dysgonomonas sp.]SBV91851.1 hypothetical protein KL86DYS1_10449 [uncultured Dysgonomonas sp.]